MFLNLICKWYLLNKYIKKSELNFNTTIFELKWIELSLLRQSTELLIRSDSLCGGVEWVGKGIYEMQIATRKWRQRWKASYITKNQLSTIRVKAFESVDADFDFDSDVICTFIWTGSCFEMEWQWRWQYIVKSILFEHHLNLKEQCGNHVVQYSAVYSVIVLCLVYCDRKQNEK